MSAPTPQLVLRLIAGSSRDMLRVFTAGVPVPPFSVGTRGDWVVEASGVEPVHFFATFDGARLHVSIGSPTARLTVRLNAVGREWMLAEPPSAMIFGEACFALSQEVIPSAAPPAPEHALPVRTQFIDPGAAGAVRLPATPFPPVNLGGTALIPGGSPTGFAPVPAQPRVRSQPVTAPTPSLQTQPQAAYGQPYGGEAPAYPGPPQQNPHAGYPAQPPMQPPLAPIAVQPVWAQPELPQAVPRPLAGSNEPLAVAFDDSGPTTLVDRGALRDHAAMVATATPSVSAASAEAYAAKVKALATGPEGALPAPPGAAPQHSPSNPPLAGQASAPPAAALQSNSEKAAKPASRLVAEWRRASWVMRLMIVLFPLGAYVSIWTPGEDDPITLLIQGSRPKAVVAKAKHPSTAKSHDAATPVASGASSAVVASSTGSPAAGASAAPVPGASAVAAAASARDAAPEASSGTPSALASAEPSIAVLGAGTKQGAARAGGKARAGHDSDELPRDVVSERAAIDAAFEGRDGEAASLYDRLAKGPNAPVFVLAARLVRADAVRKPAISH